MNVYDFDHTIYNGDSSIDFYFWCLKRKPLLLRFLPKQIISTFAFVLGKSTRKEFKESFFCFLRGIDSPEDMAIKFWKCHERKIKPWYLARKSQGDIIVSAGPEFLLKWICETLGIALVATKMDSHTGKIFGENVRGEVKVRCLCAALGMRQEEIGIERFYSDSKSDLPLALISEKAFLVRKNKIMECERRLKSNAQNQAA